MGYSRGRARSFSCAAGDCRLRRARHARSVPRRRRIGPRPARRLASARRRPATVYFLSARILLCGFSWASRRISVRSDGSSGGPAGLRVRIRPAASDELAVPAQQRLRLDREALPGRPRKRAAQRRQQRTVSSPQRRPCLPAQHSQFTAWGEDLQLLRATRPRQQPHEGEQVPHDEIHERPEQAALPRPRQEQRT